jgi:hypothetical protein
MTYRRWNDQRPAELGDQFSGAGVPSVSGTVFSNTTFTTTGTMQFYKSPGSPAALINCVLPVNTGSSVAWVRGNAPVRQNLYSLTYHSKDSNGNPAVIVDGPGRRSSDLRPAGTGEPDLQNVHDRRFGLDYQAGPERPSARRYLR